MCAMIDLFCQVATFGDITEEDWFKTALIEIGTLEWVLDLFFQLKLIVDFLEAEKLFNSQ